MCVCVLELAQALPHSPQGKVRLLGPGRTVQTSQKELLELEGLAQNSASSCAGAGKKRKHCGVWIEDNNAMDLVFVNVFCQLIE